MMQTKRDWLVAQGLAKAGRGKFSNAAKEALAKAEAEGVKFSDSTAAAPAKGKEEKATGKAKPVVVRDDGNTPYLTQDEYRFPESEYRAVSFVDGKKTKISLRECCNTCMVSLVNHMCDRPTVHNNILVKIERV